MGTKIKIFTTEKEIDLDRLISTRALVWSNSGGGKSYTSRKILEETHGKVMQIVLDTEGEYRTLREKYEYLLIAKDGDVELNVNAAKLLPEKLLGLGVSTIIDLSDLKKGERINYMKNFLRSLMEIPRGPLWKPCIFFIDEVHTYAGQQEFQDSCPDVIDLATRGRKRGYCLIGCTQRIAKLHKDVVAELNNYFVGRMSLDIDRKRTADILGFNTKEQEQSLKELEEGEFYVFGPAINKGIEKIKVGLVQTTHPEPGKIIEMQDIKLTPNVLKMIEKLNDLPKEEAKKIKDMQDLIKEIALLKRHKCPIVRPVVTQENEEKRVKELNKAKEEGFEEAKGEYISQTKILETDLKTLKQLITKLVSEGNKILTSHAFSRTGDFPIHVGPKPYLARHIQTNIGVIKEDVKPQTNQVRMVDRELIDSDGSKIPKASGRIYSFLFENPEKKFSIEQLAFSTGYSASGSFSTALYWLTGRGLAVKDGLMIKLGEVDPSFKTEEIGTFSPEFIKQNLPLASQKIFEILYENPNDEISLEELASRTGYSLSGSFSTAVYKLTGMKVAIKSGQSLKLNPEILEL